MNSVSADNEQFLSLRLGAQDSEVLRQLRARSGLSKTDIVKRALRLLAKSTQSQAGIDLYALGESSFGRYGDVTRQSGNIKSVVRERLAAKRS